MTLPETSPGVGDPDPAPGDSHAVEFGPGRFVAYDRAAEVLSIRDCDGGALTVAADVRSMSEPGPHLAIVVSGHRLGLEQIRLLEQALYWHRYALSVPPGADVPGFDGGRNR